MSKKNKKTRRTKKRKPKKENEDDFGRFQKFFALIRAFYETSHQIRKTIVVEKLHVNARFGSEDAAFTGMVVGFAYAETYKLIGFISVIFTVIPPEIEIIPVFEDKKIFELDAEGIIKTKLAHIIFTAFKFYFKYKKAVNGKD